MVGRKLTKADLAGSAFFLPYAGDVSSSERYSISYGIVKPPMRKMPMATIGACTLGELVSCDGTSS